MSFNPDALTLRQRNVLEAGTRVARIVASQAPAVDYTPVMLDEARASVSPAALREMKEAGLEDFETWYVMTRFFREYGVERFADPFTRRLLLNRAKRLDKASFRRNPYLAGVKIREEREGKFLLTEGRYARGEIFQYGMPDFSEEYTVPKLGFFSSPVRFPSLYEGDTPWMSVCPSEIASMEQDIADARGRVLVLGLGLGYFPYMALLNPETVSVTVVERSPEIVGLFRGNLLPQFPDSSRIRIIEADAFDFLARTEDGTYDYVFCDLWFGVSDGIGPYMKLKEHEKRLPGARFRYWIGEQIEAFI